MGLDQFVAIPEKPLTSFRLHYVSAHPHILFQLHFYCHQVMPMDQVRKKKRTRRGPRRRRKTNALDTGTTSSPQRECQATHLLPSLSDASVTIATPSHSGKQKRSHRGHRSRNKQHDINDTARSHQ